ncbi:hypothetical protein AVEN_186761-1 [Araneus ventricosus]|uniref:Uncharacterized protein n=1 Tax=Araneus ventricosus TaxID=182803 RepID=A0A4Y2Q1U3_ARAVE|nr:hypothetical protein AVEN_186761-1 [Araneus ventricosus]
MTPKQHGSMWQKKKDCLDLKCVQITARPIPSSKTAQRQNLSGIPKVSIPSIHFMKFRQVFAESTDFGMMEQPIDCSEMVWSNHCLLRNNTTREVDRAL